MELTLNTVGGPSKVTCRRAQEGDIQEGLYPLISSPVLWLFQSGDLCLNYSTEAGVSLSFVAKD